MRSCSGATSELAVVVMMVNDPAASFSSSWVRS